MITISDAQATMRPVAKEQGFISQHPMELRQWVEGPMRTRPIDAPCSAVFQTTDTGEAYIYLHPVWQIGKLAMRPKRAKDGTAWWAQDIDALYIWED